MCAHLDFGESEGLKAVPRQRLSLGRNDTFLASYWRIRERPQTVSGEQLPVGRKGLRGCRPFWVNRNPSMVLGERLAVRQVHPLQRCRGASDRPSVVSGQRLRVEKNCRALGSCIGALVYIGVVAAAELTCAWSSKS